MHDFMTDCGYFHSSFSLLSPCSVQSSDRSFSRNWRTGVSSFVQLVPISSFSLSCELFAISSTRGAQIKNGLSAI
jgi:hypothetical protein